jgi:threonine 3-dehydrogenase
LVAVEKTGICDTDLQIEAWDAWAAAAVPTPLVIGHEFVGSVVEVGSNVNDFAPGDRVSGEGHVVCGRCRNCMAGRRHLCANTSSVGVDRPGAFAELISIPMTNVWHHAADIDGDIAAVFAPLGNAVHTALTFRTLGEDVLITGAGPVGLMATAVVRHAGARRIVVTDLNPYRLDLARKLGATVAVDAAATDLAEVQRELGMVEGFDVGLEMSGKPAALRSTLTSMAHGGRVAVLGIPQEEIAIDWSQVVLNMLTIKGVYGREMYETWYMTSVLLESGLDIAPVLTHRFHYTEYEQAFAAAAGVRAGKVLLDWSSDV